MEPRFNPATGEWEHLSPQPQQQSMPQMNRASAGGSRDFVATAGNAVSIFALRMRPIVENVLTWLFWIAGALVIILYFADGDFVVPIIFLIVFGWLYIILTKVIGFVLSWVIYMPFALLRLVFYNKYILLIEIVAALALLYW